ncbi:MAG TPA: hypothetical protein VL357_01700 [Rariglobus sp.]|jgi:hypothetical protein|nr:hypothetical protein [Rariglobus sp.]
MPAAHFNTITGADWRIFLIAARKRRASTLERITQNFPLKTSPENFLKFCATMGLPAPVAEHQFEPARRWRFDWAWLDSKIALEIEGGVWTGGRHTSSAGFAKDMSKYNRASVLGWRVLRVQPKELLTLATVQMVKEARCA